MNKNNANCKDRKRYIDIHRNTFVFLNHMLKTHFMKSMTKAEVYTGIHLHKLTRKKERQGKQFSVFFKAHIGRNSAGPC